MIPPAFKKMCLWFHQDIRYEFPDPKDWPAYALQSLDEREKAIVKEYVNELLTGPYSVEELQDIWAESGADWFLEDKSLRPFLALIRDSIR